MKDYNIPDFDVKKNNVQMHIHYSFFRRRLRKAQKLLEEQVIRDLEPYIPYKTGKLTRTVQSMSKDGKIYAAVPPYGTKLYPGTYMSVDGQIKEYNFNRKYHPKAQAQWGDAAKRDHLKEWQNLVRSTLKKG